MSTEIFEDTLVNEDKRKGAQIVHWISILILWAGIGYCGINGLWSEIKVVAGIVLLILSTGIMYFNYELGVKVAMGTILIGIINLVSFFPIKLFISFGIDAIEIGFEFLLFSVGVIHYFTNRKELSKYLTDLLSREISEEEEKFAQRSRINGFKRRFASMQIDELESIINNADLLPEAIKAAKVLMEEKKNP